MSSSPSLVIVAGTYDGVLAGWESDDTTINSLNLTFATAVHDGSIRSLCLSAASPSNNNNTTTTPGTLVSCGYDEMLKTHDWSKRLNSSGEIRTPADFGTPVSACFAPPTSHSTHCLVGFTGGKLVVYKKRDWSVQHVLPGHDGGVASVAVHPSGKLALTGGQSDGKLKLWDLTRGRLAYVTKLAPSAVQSNGKTRHDPVASLEWSADGSLYGWACGNHVTVRATDTGKDWLDVELPSRVNQMVVMEGDNGMFVAAACNDGSLPVLSVQDFGEERRAIMAIEPVDNPVAGEERFKCIRSLGAYHVVTANSAGVISVMDLEGATRMIMQEESANDEENEQSDDESDANSKASSDEEKDLAVDILQSVQLGSGARITCLVAWYNTEAVDVHEEIDETPAEEAEQEDSGKAESDKDERGTKRNKSEIEMDPAAVEKARALVSKAKKLKKRKERKRQKTSRE